MSTATDLFLSRVKDIGFDVDRIWSQVATADSNELNQLIIKYGVETYKNPKMYNELAGALRIWQLYQKAPITIEGYLKIFEDFLRPDVVEFIRDNSEELFENLNFSKDFEYMNLAAATMINNYLSKRHHSELPMEIPQFMIMRVAVGSSLSRGMPFVLKTIEYFNKRLIALASPTIYNMGFTVGAPTSCMVMVIDDSLEDIFSVITEMAMASKNNAGIGVALNHLRHSEIGRSGESKGIVPLMKILDDCVEYVNQGGRRPGATTATLPIWHYDINDFITIVDKVKSDMVRVRKLNTSVMVCDLFMQRVKDDGDWYTMCPNIAAGISKVYGEEFNSLYLKYEKMAIRHNLWKRYQHLLLVYKSSEDKTEIYKQLFEVMKEFESPEYITFFIYKHIKSSKQGMTPVEQIFMAEHGENCELFAKRERFEILSAKNNAVEIAKNNAMKSTFVAKNKEQFTLDSKEQEEFIQLRNEVHNISLPKKAVAPPVFKNHMYKARSLMNTICDQQRKSGMPYIIHGDTINNMSPNQNVGMIYSLNLCQEIALPTIPKEQTATCNIASICLKNMWIFNPSLDKVFDFKTLAKVSQHMIYLLNDILDQATNIQDKAKASNKAIRPIGLGVNGWAELMHELDYTVIDMNCLNFDLPIDKRYKEKTNLDPRNEKLIHEVWSCIYHNALTASSEESKYKGPYEMFETSDYAKGILHFHRYNDESIFTHKGPADPKIWDGESWSDLIEKIKIQGLRNSTVTTQMPTATSAQVLDASESTEFGQNMILRRIMGGDYVVQNYYLVDDLKQIGLWNRQVYEIISNNRGSIRNIPEDSLPEKTLKRLQYLKEKYRTIYEIPQRLRIQEEGIRQKFTDQARSFNLFFEDPSKRILTMSHYEIWRNKLKSSYYIRSRSVLKNMTFHKTLGIVEDNSDDLICTSCVV